MNINLCAEYYKAQASNYTWLADRLVDTLQPFEAELEILFTPAELQLTFSGDPTKLALALSQECDIVFSRRLNADGSYDWVSEIDGIPLAILSTEVLDFSGTLVDLTPKQQEK